MTKPLTSRWFNFCFDRNWVRCAGFDCKKEFFYKDIKHKRKCPACKLDNNRCRRTK